MVNEKEAMRALKTPPAELKRQRMEKAYADARNLFTSEKANDGQIMSTIKKYGRKYFADPVMDYFEPDMASAREEYRARKEVLGYKCGGSVKMAKGGSVCRGGGAATRGIKFRGVK